MRAYLLFWMNIWYIKTTMTFYMINEIKQTVFCTTSPHFLCILEWWDFLTWQQSLLSEKWQSKLFSTWALYNLILCRLFLVLFISQSKEGKGTRNRQSHIHHQIFMHYIKNRGDITILAISYPKAQAIFFLNIIQLFSLFLIYWLDEGNNFAFLLTSQRGKSFIFSTIIETNLQILNYLIRRINWPSHTIVLT